MNINQNVTHEWAINGQEKPRGITVVDLLKSAWRTINRWQLMHKQRQALGKLDDRMLKDIGVTRHQAERETDKLFWEV